MRCKTNIYIFCFIISGFVCSCASLGAGNRNGTIVIPFILEGNRLVVQATVNGTEGRYLFDTGAFPSITTAPLDNLPLVEDEFMPYAMYKIKNGIIINNQRIKSESFIYNPDPRSPRVEVTQYILENEGFDGILGYSAFVGYWCEISFTENHILLHKKKPERLFKSFQIQAVYPAHFYVPVQIDYKPFWFMFDTGNPIGLSLHNTFVKHFLDSDYHEVLYVSGKAFEFKTRVIKTFDDYFINKYITTDMKAPFVDLGMMGMEYLQYYDFLLDYTRLYDYDGEQAVIYYRQRFPEVDKYTRDFTYMSGDKVIFGIEFVYTGELIYVVSVKKRGIAYNEYGLLPGMSITHINEISLNGLSVYDELQKAFYVALDDDAGTLTVIDIDQQQRILRRHKIED